MLFFTLSKVRNVASGVNVGLSSLVAMASLPPKRYENDIENYRREQFSNQQQAGRTGNTTNPSDLNK